MADNRLQRLYDRAFEKWQAKEKEEAIALIEEAVELAPNDPAVHALAFHIKRMPPFGFENIVHAERILDIDVHYCDIIDKDDGGRGFTRDMMLGYSILSNRHSLGINDKRYDDAVDPDDLTERFCKYSKKLLEAGYGIPNIDSYFSALTSKERYADVIQMGQCLAGLFAPEEIGLPGLAHTKLDTDMFDSGQQQIAEAFARTFRNDEALEWCRHLIAAHPNDWSNYSCLGEIYCRLGHPAEAARQWIIAHQKGEYIEASEMNFHTLCQMVVDPAASKKAALRSRIDEMKAELPADQKVIADKLSKDMLLAIGNPKKEIYSETYVTETLGQPLPPLKPSHFIYYRNLWLPNQGTYPFIPETTEEETQISAPVPAVEPASVVAKTAPKAPKTIESVGIDLTERAENGQLPPIVGRDKEIDALVRILLRMEKNNPVLLGEAGVGKTAVLQGLAGRIAAENVPPYLRGKRVIEITMSALVAGTMWRGDFEQRIIALLAEAKDNPDIILFVDELHTIMGAGAAKRGELDAANIVKPALAKGELRLVGATTTSEYTQFIEKDPAMSRRFTPVRVPELSKDATLEVLKQRRAFWKKSHRVEIADNLLSLAVELTGQYIGHRRFPDKAIDLLDESSAFAKTQRPSKSNAETVLKENELRHVLMEWTGAAAPGAEDEVKTPDKPRRISRDTAADSICKQFIGNQAVIDQLADIALQVRLSIKDSETPLGVLLHGPAKAGKTTCASAFADAVWPGAKDRVLTLNLSEYNDPAGLGRLIGFPPGYTGHQTPGVLTARLKRQPYSIILLKRLEEAAPNVIRFLAEAMRNGAYADNRSKETISVATAVFMLHVDTEGLAKPVGFRPVLSQKTSDSSDTVLKRLKRQGIRFPLTHEVAVAELNKETAAGVIRLQTERHETLFAQKGVQLVILPDFVERLATTLCATESAKRDPAALVENEIRPRVRDALLQSDCKAGPVEVHID